MTRVAALAFVFALFASQSPGAQTNETGDTLLNTLACEVLPVPLKVDVEVMDNAERFLRFKDRFVQKLRAKGVEVVDGAPLTLILDVQTVLEFDQAQGDQFLEFRAGQESGEAIGREGDIFMSGKVWSNRSDSVLGGRRRGRGQLALDQLHVTAAINTRTDGRCLWEGEIRHNLRGSDPDEAALLIMPYLAGAVGKSVKNRSINIFTAPGR